MPTLDVFDRVLRDEAHNLQRRPELTWQQLHNQLEEWLGQEIEYPGRAAR